MFLGVFGDGGKKHPKKIGNGSFEVRFVIENSPLEASFAIENSPLEARFAIGNSSFLPRLCQK